MTTPTANDSSAERVLPPGTKLGDFTLGNRVSRQRLGDVYGAQRQREGQPAAPAYVLCVHRSLAQQPSIRDPLIAGVRAAATAPAHPGVLKTEAAGLTGDILWIATEAVAGFFLHDAIASAREGRLPAPVAAHLASEIAQTVSELPHGALTSESVFVARDGRVLLFDYAFIGGLRAAAAHQLLSLDFFAPEIHANGSTPSAATDVFGLGTVVYHACIGRPTAIGGPRPTSAVPTLPPAFDDLLGRSCHRDPARRPEDPLSLALRIREAAHAEDPQAKMAWVQKVAITTSSPIDTLRRDSNPAVPARPSSPAIAATAAARTDATPAPPRPATPVGARDATPVPRAVAARLRDPALEKALQAALADTTEKWLVTKANLDYGPFPLSEVITQIERGDIQPKHTIVDKDTGARAVVGEHPLLGPMVMDAQARINEQRRAAAEVHAQTKAKRAGAALYLTIALGIAAAAGVVYFVVQRLTAGRKDEVATVAALSGGTANATVSLPKAPPKAPRKAGGGRGPSGGTSGGGAVANSGSEDLALDMSGDDDESAMPLDMSTVFSVYSKASGALGGCLASTGERSAAIGIIIDGPSGRINFVKVNGKTAGPLHACLARVLRGLKFPAAGSRTRAEFEIGM